VAKAHPPGGPELGHLWMSSTATGDANFMRPDSNDRGEMAADIAIRIIADARL
jgi:hypothetical protein